MRVGRLLTLVVAVVLGLALGARAGDDAALTAEDRADLAWFEGLEYAEIAGKPFVHVRVSPHAEVRGFLVDAPPDRIRVVGLGLETWDIARSAPGTPEDRRVVVEELRADDLAEAWLRGGPSPSLPRDGFPRPAEPSVQTEMLVLAAHLHGTDAKRNVRLVHSMLAHARSMWPDRWRGLGALRELSRPLHGRTADDLAAVETHRLQLWLVGEYWLGEILPPDRGAQLAAAREILRRFPGTAEEPEVRELADTLERMVREAAERASRGPPAADAPPAERVADLVFRLREEIAAGGNTMGGGLGQIESGPYRELVALGRDAVPALLTALADDSLTPYGGSGRSGVSPYLLRVGDVVLMAIEEIAGRRFAPSDMTTLPRGGSRREYKLAWREQVRPLIEAWHAGAEPEREPPALIRRVEAGGRDAVVAAPLLLDKAPADFAPAILRALANEGDVRVHYDLLALLAQRPGEEGREALHHAATEGDPRGRTDAAFHLANSGDPAAVEILLDLWKTRRSGDGPPAYYHYIHIGDRQDELTRIAKWLLGTGRADVTRVLVEAPLEHSPAARRVLVRALIDVQADAAPDVTALIESTLATLLLDRTEMTSLGWRVCDEAASAVATARGLRAPSTDQPMWMRDLLIHALAGADAAQAAAPWSPDASPLEEPAELRDLLAAIASNDPGSEPRADALRAVEALGLAALPSLREGLTAGRFARGQLDVAPLAGRIAFVVRKVLIHGSPPDALRERVVALEGAMLTSPRLHDTVIATLQSVGASFPGAGLDVFREADDTGVVITLTALDGTSGGWQTGVVARVGEKSVPTAFGHNAVFPPRREPSLHALCDAALAAPPGVRSWLHAVSVFTGPN